MKVKDKILYQIAKNRDFKIGDVIHFGEEDNGQVQVYDFSFALDGKPLHEYAFKDAQKGIFKNRKRIEKYAIGLSEYDFLLRELALEEVRKEKFPNLPSRFKCMYLLDSKDQTIKNLNFYKKVKSEQLKQIQAIAVRVTGEVFYCRDFYLGRRGRSWNEHKDVAEKYWSQSQNSDKEIKEILFVGDAEVVEILDEVKNQNI